jgi:hypothetical protein
MNEQQKEKAVILLNELEKVGYDPIMLLQRELASRGDFESSKPCDNCRSCKEQKQCYIRIEALRLVQSKELHIRYDKTSAFDHEIFTTLATFCDDYEVINDELFTGE